VAFGTGNSAPEHAEPLILIFLMGALCGKSAPGTADEVKNDEVEKQVRI
jgi:hypothetical protein